MAVSTSFALGLGNNKSVLLNGIHTLSKRILELFIFKFDMVLSDVFLPVSTKYKQAEHQCYIYDFYKLHKLI